MPFVEVRFQLYNILWDLSKKYCFSQLVSVPKHASSVATELVWINNKAMAGQQRLRNPGGIAEQTHLQRWHCQSKSWWDLGMEFRPGAQEFIKDWKLNHLWDSPPWTHRTTENIGGMKLSYYGFEGGESSQLISSINTRQGHWHPGLRLWALFSCYAENLEMNTKLLYLRLGFPEPRACERKCLQ